MQSSIDENINLTRSCVAHRGIFRDSADDRSTSEELISDLSIRCNDSQQLAGTLSGGNQQKVVLARWLALKPNVLLLDEPTRGVDIGARSEIYELLFKLAERGMGILFVSSELEEIIGIADRVLVINQGRLQGELLRQDLSEHALMMMASETLESAA